MSFRETEQLELKKSTSLLKEGIVSMVSILNKHQKGELYFGIKNDGVTKLPSSGTGWRYITREHSRKVLHLRILSGEKNSQS